MTYDENGVTNKERVMNFLRENALSSFTVNELAKELDITASTVSSMFSAPMLPAIPVEVAFTDKNLLNKDVRHFQYAPTKVLGKPHKYLPKVKDPAVKKPKKAVEVGRLSTVRKVRDDEMFAKVLDRVGDEVVLKLSNGDIVKGKVMR